MSKRKKGKGTPTGFIAICRCGNIVGVLNYRNTPQEQIGAIMGEWFHKGYNVQARFGRFNHKIQKCECYLQKGGNQKLKEIVDNLHERFTGMTDSRFATEDEIRIAWLLSEIRNLKGILKVYGVR